MNKKPNKLINEQSPYLLQHAYNPVSWYPWCEEAFELAKKENKPIFLSIGYSTCHWCHVMEHESFEDEEVARLMNETFISIKVDREERPDIDNVYMTVCQMMTGSGGWPLTIIMDPDKKPFFSGTYFPKESNYGRIGMLELIPKIKELWTKRHEEVTDSANQITAFLQNISNSNSPSGELKEDVLKTVYEQFKSRFDKDYGGFGKAPKFPTPHNFLFLLRYWNRTKDEYALQMVEKSLKQMRLGGIFDHIGFGFHRYSTDSKWFLPHFEKMLYDQAMLAMAYLEAFQVTKKDEYAQTAREIFTYVLRDMKSPEGGFYSAEDADSEGEEGKFYVWSVDEIRKLLTKEEAELIIKVFNISPGGNYAGANILHMEESLSKITTQLDLVESIRQKLFLAREKRVHPHKDDKILTDWNGLMISALSKGAQILNEPIYKNAAVSGVDFILKKMFHEGKLLHSYRDSQAKVLGYLSDYAFFIWGLIELYETTFDVKYIKTAIELNQDLLKHFLDEKNGGFFFTRDNAENLLVRQKEIYDGAIPSSNSICMLNFLRLSKITANQKLEKEALRIAKCFAKDIEQSPIAYTQFLVALDFMLGPSSEVVVVGHKDSDDTKAMLKALRENFLPNKIVILKSPEVKSQEIIDIASFINPYEMINGKATAYVCRNYACELPTNDVNKMLELF